MRPPPPPLCLYGLSCPRRAPPPRAGGTNARQTRGPKPGGRTRGIVSLTVLERVSRGAGSRASGHDDRMTPPSLCFLSWRAGSPPPDAAIRGPLGLRLSSLPIRSPPIPTPRPSTSSQAPAPSFPPLTVRGLECRSQACARRRRGGTEPRPGDELARRPGVAAAGGKQVGASGEGGATSAAAGYFFVPAAAPSVAWTRRSSGSGRREARGGRGGGGGRTGGRGG